MSYSKAITSSDAQLWVDRIPALTDNYIWAINSVDHREAVIVDPGDAQAVVNYLDRAERLLGAIIITHSHADHIGGLNKLVEDYPGVPVYGPAHERIAASTIVGEEGALNIAQDCLHHCDFFDGALSLEVINVPGHLHEHVAYVSTSPAAPWIFSGDIVFSAGCGRNFEGDSSELFHSFQRLMAYPDNSAIFAVHEYTRDNLRFAEHIEPDNQAVLMYKTKVRLLRDQEAATSPTTVGLEKLINPFARCHLAEVQAGVANAARLAVESPEQCFTTMRKLKDKFY